MPNIMDMTGAKDYRLLIGGRCCIQFLNLPDQYGIFTFLMNSLSLAVAKVEQSLAWLDLTKQLYFAQKISQSEDTFSPLVRSFSV